MNSVFAARLTKLRRERGMSQKDAAKMLGVSQSLLSHYEKGIRECSLDFVCRASNFFDVSCDYLLGQVDTRRSLSEEFDMTDTVQDGEYRTSTLFRASVMLNDSMINCGSPEKLKDYFALSIYRMAVCAANGGYIPKKWISLDCETSPVFGSVLMTDIIRELMAKANQESQKNIAEPKCVKTVVEHSEKLIRKRAAELAAEKSRG